MAYGNPIKDATLGATLLQQTMSRFSAEREKYMQEEVARARHQSQDQTHERVHLCSRPECGRTRS